MQAPAPGYNPKLYEGVFSVSWEMSGVKIGNVVQTKARAKVTQLMSSMCVVNKTTAKKIEQNKSRPTSDVERLFL